MNNYGDVVGYSEDDVANHLHAFLYHDGRMMELTDLVVNLNGWRVSRATRINDAGEIMCRVYNDERNELQTALLTPLN